MKKYWQLFITFARIGLFTIGGGYAMLPMMQSELVERHGWATEQEMMDYYALAQCTPGAIAVNVSTFIGYKIAGVLGGVIATLGLVFPSLVIIIAIAAVLVGGGLSLLASGNPDGLEWSLFGNSDAGYTQNMGLDEDSYGVQSSAADKAGTVQEKTAFLPDYSFAGSDSAAGTSVSGIAGAAIVAAAAALICGVGGICRHKKNHSQ